MINGDKHVINTYPNNWYICAYPSYIILCTICGTQQPLVSTSTGYYSEWLKIMEIANALHVNIYKNNPSHHKMLPSWNFVYELIQNLMYNGNLASVGTNVHLC